MVTVFLSIVALLAVQRLFEIRLSKRNEARILAEGGKEYAPGHYPAMVALHSLWFAAMVAEIFLLKPAFNFPFFVAAFFFMLSGQALRYSAITTLGRRWSTRIMILPEKPTVDDGIYRYIRHPNYLGVALEIAAVPLLHSAYVTAAVFSIANIILLRTRIRAEERALEEHNRYQNHFGDLHRFLPKISKS